MSDFAARISALLSALSMKQTVFAERLNLSPSYVSRIIAGDKVPSDRTIQDICDKFKVSEEWLRTGQGEMFRPVSRDEEIMEFMGDVMSGTPSDFRRRFISVLARMTPEEWAILEAKVRELAAEDPETEKGPDAE